MISPEMCFTIDCETFAAHILALRSRYLVVRTEELVNRLRERSPYAGTAAVIHFDDSIAIVLSTRCRYCALRVPATHFINTGFINTDRRFNHDEGYPFLFENLTEENVREWVRAGYEVGAHTVNHVDLGRVPLEVRVQRWWIAGDNSKPWPNAVLACSRFRSET